MNNEWASLFHLVERCFKRKYVLLVLFWTLQTHLHFNSKLHQAFMEPSLTTDLFLLAGIGFFLSGSPCWHSFPWQRGHMRKVLCCGTVPLYTPSTASYTHSMSLPSLWRLHWLKELTSDPDGGAQSSAPALSPPAGMLTGFRYSSFHLWGKKKFIQTLEKCDFIIKKDSGPVEVSGNSSSKHIALITDVNVLYTVFASGNSLIFPMLVYTVKFCFPKEK